MFNNLTGQSTSKTQADLVQERIEGKPLSVTEELSLPGVPLIHTLDGDQLVGLFNVVLKSRPNILELDVSLGTYEYVEQRTNIAGSDKLHMLSKLDIANALASALASNQKACGLHAIISSDAQGNTASRLFVKLTDEVVKTTVYDDRGNLVEDGDSKFKPVIKVTYRPA